MTGQNKQSRRFSVKTIISKTHQESRFDMNTYWATSMQIDVSRENVNRQCNNKQDAKQAGK